MGKGKDTVIKKYRITLILVLIAVIGMPLAAYYTHMKYRHKLMEETAKNSFVWLGGVGQKGYRTLLKQENGELYELFYDPEYPEGAGNGHNEQHWQGRFDSIYTFSHKGKMYAVVYYYTIIENTSHIVIFTEEGDVCKSLLYEDFPEYWRIKNNRLIAFNHERYSDPKGTEYSFPYTRKAELMDLDTLEYDPIFLKYRVVNGKSVLKPYSE